MSIESDLNALADPERAKVLSRFFKTGKGEYGQGDKFLGITVPRIRKLVTTRNLEIREIAALLKSDIHEYRLAALLSLVKQFLHGNHTKRKAIYDFYIQNLDRVNNWDLVDLSAPNIVGLYLMDKDKSILNRLAISPNLWYRRVSIVATFAFIRKGNFVHTFDMASLLISDGHDLIHKAVGWMLREIGKRDQDAEEEFLKKHHKRMPRTMLRYAIERFDPKKRSFYMSKINPVKLNKFKSEH